MVESTLRPFSFELSKQESNLMAKKAKEESLITPVITKHDLTIRVEGLVKSDGVSYVEAIIQVCEELDIDPEDMAKLVVGPLRDKLEAEAQRNNIIPRSNTGTLFSDE